VAIRMNSYQRVEVTSRKQWRDWLAANHEQKESIWLITYKKHTGARWLPVAAAVEEALCFGWIDSSVRKLDDDRWMMLMSPRRPNSVWSLVNKERVQRLLDQGLVMPAGLSQIAAAKENGAWTFLDDVCQMVVPEDLAAALKSAPGAKAAYEACTVSAKRMLLHNIKMAKRTETRQKRIQQFVAQFESGGKLAARQKRSSASSTTSSSASADVPASTRRKRSSRQAN
jgi:uncharacterized protein YdeI (YjbR/CyaY-like superfamily)